jgi:hypothetical protein
MRVLKEATFEEVLSCHDRKNLGSASFVYTADQLRTADKEVGGRWTLATLSREDTLNIMLPTHRHPAENPDELIPKPGLTVSVAAGRVRELTRETGLCWENIHFHKALDFSQNHVFLKFENGGLKHLDGLHRLLAWAVFDKKEEVLAYVAGVIQ